MNAYDVCRAVLQHCRDLFKSPLLEEISMYLLSRLYGLRLVIQQDLLERYMISTYVDSCDPYVTHELGRRRLVIKTYHA